MSVPFLDVRAAWSELEDELREAAFGALDSGQYIGGDALTRFESDFAAYCEASDAVGVGNGLEALRLSLEAAGIGPGDEVIVPSHTFIATWLAVSQVGATIVPVDPAPGYFTIDPQQIAAAVTPATRAIMPVHLYGQPCDMDPIIEIARNAGILVLEDAAQAHGARYRGRRIGAQGDTVSWSFYPGKNLGAFGDGGGVTTNNAELAEKIRMLSNYGSKVKYEHVLAGCNSRLDPIQAAMLSVKLRKLDEWNDRRRAIAARYSAELSDLPLALPATPDWAEPVWHLYVLRSARRDDIHRHLGSLGVHSGLHYPHACFDQPAYAQFGPRAAEWPEARAIAAECLSLPIGPHMDEDQVSQVITAVRSFDW